MPLGVHSASVRPCVSYGGHTPFVRCFQGIDYENALGQRVGGHTRVGDV